MTTSTETLTDVIASFDNAMLLTGLSTGINGRPMAISENNQGELWFITSKTSPKAQELKNDEHAVVTFQSKTAYAVVYGRATLIYDKAKLTAMWNKGADLYFPDGPSSDQAVLLRFRPDRGEYWDMRGTKGLAYAAKAVKALVTGDGVNDPEDSHGRAQL